MPLQEVCSKDAFHQNVKELVTAGHPQDVAVAIAYRVLRKACGGKTAVAASEVKGVNVPPKEALRFFAAKGLKPGFSYLDVWRDAHKKAFTVAKVMELDLLADVKASIEGALRDGTPFEAWAKDIRPTLDQSGWSAYGTEETAPRRLKTIYQTNMRMARAVGQQERIQRTKATLPFLKYELGPSEKHREEHVAWAEAPTILPADDPWWEDHTPPLGYGCRCWVRQISTREALELGGQTEAPDDEAVDWTNPKTGQTEEIPAGVDPGFDYPKTPTGEAQALDDVEREAT